jgi:osmotically-inducible protein OsmY
MRKLVLLALAAGAAAWAFTGRRGEILRGRIKGLVSGLQTKDYDDVTLKAKVESELFRHEHEVKGAVDVNAQEGIVQLRGELPSQGLIDALVARTKQIHGVREVENLLHTTGTEAPMHH